MIIIRTQTLWVISIAVTIFAITAISITTPPWWIIGGMIFGISLMWYALGEIKNHKFVWKWGETTHEDPPTTEE